MVHSDNGTLQMTLLLESVSNNCIQFSYARFLLVCRCLRRAWRDPSGSVRQLARKLWCSPAQRWLSRRQRRRSSGETGWRNVWVPIQGYSGICYRSVETWQQWHIAKQRHVCACENTNVCLSIPLFFLVLYPSNCISIIWKDLRTN